MRESKGFMNTSWYIHRILTELEDRSCESSKNILRVVDGIAGDGKAWETREAAKEVFI